MHASSDLTRVARLISALIAALFSACSTTENVPAAGACVQGQTEQCTCDSGAVGVRTCGSDSEYGQCWCEALSSGGAGGTAGVAGVTGGSAGLSGIGGVGGLAGGGGINPMAGTGGVAGVAGITGGSAGIGGAGGTLAAGMTGGTAGAGGTMSGGAGGVSGMDVTGGMSGGGSGGNDGPGRDPKPGELYGDCRANGACDGGLLCVNDASSGVPESYCSTTCNALMPMPCPPSRGGGMAICLFGICVR